MDSREISIALDTYDDLFSDFDPRPYASRELSRDLLDEVQRRYVETPSDRIEVRFTIPAPVRDPRAETLIKKRLREHFIFEERVLQVEIESLAKTGTGWFITGAALQFLVLGLLLWFGDANTYARAADVILGPAGWYGLFSGMDKLVLEPHNIRRRQVVWERFGKASFIFIDDAPQPA